MCWWGFDGNGGDVMLIMIAGDDGGDIMIVVRVMVMVVVMKM